MLAIAAPADAELAGPPVVRMAPAGPPDTRSQDPASPVLPSDGRFVLLESGDDGDGPAVGYLRLPDAPRQPRGLNEVWLVVFFESPRTEDGQSFSYGAMSATIDCAGHVAKAGWTVLYGQDGQSVDAYQMAGGWEPPEPGKPIVTVFGKVCGAGNDEAVLAGLAAARADANQRMANR